MILRRVFEPRNFSFRNTLFIYKEIMFFLDKIFRRQYLSNYRLPVTCTAKRLARSFFRVSRCW